MRYMAGGRMGSHLEQARWIEFFHGGIHTCLSDRFQRLGVHQSGSRSDFGADRGTEFYVESRGEQNSRSCIVAAWIQSSFDCVLLLRAKLFENLVLLFFRTITTVFQKIVEIPSLCGEDKGIWASAWPGWFS